MRTLRIRAWMVVGMLLVLILTVVFYHFTNELDQRVLQPMMQHQAQQEDAAAGTLVRAVASRPARWHDPGWQGPFRARLDTLGLGAVILAPSGATIFRGGHVGSWMQVSQKAMVLEGGRQLGTVEIFVPVHTNPLAPVSAALAVVVALLFVGWQIRRGVVRPLEAMSRAARQIADGNLDFAVPGSQVTEVAEVRSAFDVMREGLRAALTRQAALEEERRFFIGAIAHDLRTPLFALRGYLEGLEQGLATSPEKAASYVAVCRQKADQLERLVSDLFAYTKLEYLEQMPRREQVDLGSVIERAVDGLRPRAQAKGIEIALAGAEDRCVLSGDEHLLERALDNLLDNALRHTPAGGTIAVCWHAEPERVTFTIADTGSGIAAQDLPHLFDPLYRGDTSRNPETGGAGLGLTITRRIVRAHGGDLRAANRTGGGAEFTGTLPTTRQTQRPADVAAAVGAH